MRRFAKRTHSFELSPIKQIELAASKYSDAISLAQGIPYLPTPEPIREFVQEKIKEGLCDHYSLAPGIIELREELSQSLRDDGDSYDAEDEIVVTAGSIEGMTATLLSLIEPGDEVLIPSPTYTSYIGSIRLAGGIPKHVPLNEDRGFDLSVEEFEKALTSKTKAILICLPNNPTGTVYSKEEVESVLKLAVERDVLVIIDEVYKDFYFSNAQHHSPSHFPWAREKIIRVCSFSKAYSMTGWRVGFLAAPRELMRVILKVHDLMVSCAPVASQYGAIAALRYGDESRKRYIEEFQRNRDYTVSFLDELSEWLDYQVPQATYFVFPRLKDSVPGAEHSSRLAYDLLERKRVALVPGSAFGPSGESHLRINYGRSEDDLKNGLARLGDYLQEITKKKDVPINRDTEKKTQKKRELTSVESTLSQLAQINLRGEKPITIGVLGIRGKTVVRRMVHEELSNLGRTTGSILSYNSISGLCLSILGLRSPKGMFEKFLFALQAPFRAIWSDRKRSYLILEYGITEIDEVENYLSIAIPDYIILTGTRGYEEEISDSPEFFAYEEFIKRAAPKVLFVPEDEPWLKSDFAQSAERVRLLPCEEVEGSSSPTRSEVFGESVIASLREELGLDNEGSEVQDMEEV